MNFSEQPNSSNLAATYVSLTLQLLNELKTQAKKYIGGVKRKHPDVTLDDSILIIEDEYGGLMHAEGDLSFLMPNAPTLDKIFYRQLPAAIQKDYQDRQMAVWDLDMPELGNLQTKGGREGVMLPMFVYAQRWTITVFTKA
jgi:hypothetical protein